MLRKPLEASNKPSAKIIAIADEMCKGSIQDVAELEPEDRSSLVALLIRRHSRLKLMKRRVIYGMVGLFILGTPLSILLAVMLKKWCGIPFQPPFYLIILFLGIPYYTFLDMRRVEVLKAIAEVKDFCVLQFLLDEVIDDHRQGPCEDALIQMLLRFDPEKVTLTEHQRDCLYRLLKRRVHLFQPITENFRMSVQECKLKTAVVTVIGRLKDTQMLPYVERLAAKGSHHKEREQLREAAEECLMLLRQRADEDLSSMTLLRASSSVTALPEELLRPSDASAERHPEQLLQASMGKPGNKE